MGIEKLDKNFAQSQYIETDDKIKYTIPCEPFDLYGVFYDEKLGRFMRMDGDVADKVSSGVSELCRQYGVKGAPTLIIEGAEGFQSYYGVPEIKKYLASL